MTDDSLLGALLKVQKELPKLKLNKEGAGQVGSRSYSYLTLEDLHAEVLPLLNKHGLVWVTLPVADGLACKLWHASDADRIEFLIPYGLGDTFTPQELGSAISYARRYALMAAVGVVPHDEDDDGATASKGSRKPSRPAPADPERPLPETAIKRMYIAIQEAGYNPLTWLPEQGIDTNGLITYADAEKVKALLA